MSKEIPESEVKVKVSICQKCNNPVRFAVEHTMTHGDIIEFGAEVFAWDLLIKTVTLAEFRENYQKPFCKCYPV